jgi:hypothetical protein
MKQAFLAVLALGAAVGLGWLLWGRNSVNEPPPKKLAPSVVAAPIEPIEPIVLLEPADKAKATDAAKAAKAADASEKAAVEARRPRPAALTLPGAERPAEPSTQSALIESVIRPESGWEKADVQEAVKNLAILDPDELTLRERDALRWLLFERTAHETIRNDAANVLLKAKDEKLAGALCALLRDKTQTPTWRNYTVQHLAAGLERYGENKEVLDELFREALLDEAEEVREVCLFQLGRLAEAKDWRKQSPDLYRRTAELAKGFLATRKTPGDWVAGVRAVGQLGLSDETGRLSTWLADEKIPLGIRQTIAAELGRVSGGGDESAQAAAKTALQGVLKHHNKLLRESAEKSLKSLEKQGQ